MNVDLTDRETLRGLLHAHGMRLQKSLGQHLLISREAIDASIQAADIQSDEQILEVGSGMGVLTVELAKKARQVTALEVDPQIIQILKETTRDYQNVHILQQDLLRFNPVSAFVDSPYKIVANLPYYITAPTLRHFLEALNPPKRMVLMVQYEVARRVLAEPGEMSVLAISVQFYGKATLVRKVPAASFYPPPRVDSAIISIDVLSEPALKIDNRKRFFRLIHAGFSQKRKQLHNTLSGSLAIENPTVRQWLENAEIQPARRAETLSLYEWKKLYDSWPEEKNEGKPGKRS